MKSRVTLVALAVGVLAAAYVWYRFQEGATFSDLENQLIAARALLAREDPYAAVRASGEPWPLYYPATAALVVAPLAWLDTLVARLVFAAVSAGVLTYAILRHRPHAWPMLVSVPMQQAVELGQLTPLLLAGVLLPPVAAIWIAKPTVSLALASGSSRAAARAAALGGAVLLLVSLVLVPLWPIEWWRTVQDAPHVQAWVMRPGGVLLLLALLRWRRPEARLLAALSLVPTTHAYYEALPLFLICRTRFEALGLAILSVVAVLLNVALSPGLDAAEQVPRSWPWLLVCLYIPSLLMILARRADSPQPSSAA